MLQRLKKNYLLLVSTFLILYFFFNLLSGQRGLISYFEKKEILKNLKQQESLIINQISDLEFKNSLLSDNLDLDYIESLIRERFIFGKKINKGFILSFVAPFMILISAIGLIFRDNSRKIFYLPIGLMGIVIILERGISRQFDRKNILKKIKAYQKFK